MTLDHVTARALSKKLIALYPRAFRQALGESMARTFDDLYDERAKQHGRGVSAFLFPIFLDIGIGVVKEHVLEISARVAMNKVHLKSAPFIGFILALPFTLLFGMLVFHIEPDLGPLNAFLSSPDPDVPNVRGSLVVLAAFLFVIAAFLINFVTLLPTVRGGETITARPFNLVVTLATFSIIAVAISAIVIDQYPCWIGVPNCD